MIITTWSSVALHLSSLLSAHLQPLLTSAAQQKKCWNCIFLQTMDMFKAQFPVVCCCNALLKVSLGLGAKASWLVFHVFAERSWFFVFFSPCSWLLNILMGGLTVETGSELKVVSCLVSITPTPSALHSDNKISLYTCYCNATWYIL